MEYTGNEAKSKGEEKKKKKTLLGRYLGSMPGMGMRTKVTPVSKASLKTFISGGILGKGKGTDNGTDKGGDEGGDKGEDTGRRRWPFKSRKHHEESDLMF